MTSAQNAFGFNELDEELHLAERLRQQGAPVFQGDTTPQARRERFRSAIVNHGLDYVIVGKHAGKCETYAAIFERLFHEPLIAKRKGKSR